MDYKKNKGVKPRQTNAADAATKKLFHPNTHLCVDLKTLLCEDRVAEVKKDYIGVFRQDAEDHFLFMESLHRTRTRRNPRVFEGHYINITRSADGAYHPNFKPVRIDASSLRSYAQGVARELKEALSCLLEK